MNLPGVVDATMKADVARRAGIWLTALDNRAREYAGPPRQRHG
jgi:hypothetical protein